MIWRRVGSKFVSGPYQIQLTTHRFQLWHNDGTPQNFYVIARDMNFEEAKARAEKHRREAAISVAEPVAASSLTVVAESGVPS